MSTSQIRVLIVEDDKVISKALDEGLKRLGAQVRVARSADEAMGATKVTDFHVAVIDCMLPGGNGTDLARDLTKRFGEHTRIILISGVFRDKSFQKDAVKKANALAFFTKPFDTEALIKLVMDQSHARKQLAGDPLANYLTAEHLTSEERIGAINAAGSIPAQNLPIALAMLMEDGIEGRLELKAADGQWAHIDFKGGKMLRVESDDKDTFFGVLCIEHGFADSEDIEHGLNMEGNLRLGEKMVAASLLSPHVIRLIKYEQMGIRISKLIGDNSFQVKFHIAEVTADDAQMDTFEFATQLHAWVESKVSVAWLKANYMNWYEHQLVRGENFDKLRHLEHLELVKVFAKEEIEHLIGGTITLQDAMETMQKSEEDFLRATHFLLAERVLAFASNVTSSFNSETKVSRLRRIWDDMQKQNYFEVLGISTKATSKEAQKAYTDLAKVLHPDRLPPTAGEELKVLTQKVFARITEAYNVLGNHDKLVVYKRNLSQGVTEDILKAEALFEKGRRLLETFRYSDADLIFDKVSQSKGHRKDLPIFMAWTKIKKGVPDKDADAFFKEMHGLISKVPPEDRHSAYYFFVKGLFYAGVGNNDKAESNFNNAIATDPKFIEAKRELAALRNRPEDTKSKSRSFLEMDVTSIFRRKKS